MGERVTYQHEKGILNSWNRIRIMGNYIKNQEILEVVHKIDKELGVHIAYCKANFKRLDEVIEDVDGNDSDGIKHQNKILYGEYEERKKEKTEKAKEGRGAVIDIKTVVITVILTFGSQMLLYLLRG